MAQNSDLQNRVCVVWNTTIPNFRTTHRSSNFCLLGSMWYLELRYYFHNSLTGRTFRVYLKRGGVYEILNESFCVTTFIEMNCDFMSLSCSKTVETTDQVIWDFSEKKIFEIVPNFTFREKWNIVCTFHCEQPPVPQTIHVSTQTSLDIPPHFETHRLDFSNLLEDEVFPDVKLRCGDSTISAHRSILAGHSQVFAAMFRNKMVESETGIVDVTDLDAPILEMLLKYVYSGKVTGLSDDVASSLYEAADKYAIHALKNACSDWMIENLTEENCISFLTVADVHGDAAFRDAVFSFINRHPEVIYSDIWLKFSEELPNLANAGYRSYVMSLRN